MGCGQSSPTEKPPPTDGQVDAQTEVQSFQQSDDEKPELPVDPPPVAAAASCAEPVHATEPIVTLPAADAPSRQSDSSAQGVGTPPRPGDGGPSTPIRPPPTKTEPAKFSPLVRSVSGSADQSPQVSDPSAPQQSAPTPPSRGTVTDQRGTEPAFIDGVEQPSPPTGSISGTSAAAEQDPGRTQRAASLTMAMLDFEDYDGFIPSASTGNKVDFNILDHSDKRVSYNLLGRKSVLPRANSRGDQFESSEEEEEEEEEVIDRAALKDKSRQIVCHQKNIEEDEAQLDTILQELDDLDLEEDL